MTSGDERRRETRKLDRPTITIPGHAPGTAPTGVSLIGSRSHDRRLLAIAAGLEDIIRIKA